MITDASTSLTVTEQARREQFVLLVSRGMPGVKAVVLCGWPPGGAEERAVMLMGIPEIQQRVMANLQPATVEMRQLFERAKEVLWRNMDFGDEELKPSDRQAAASTVVTALLRSGKPLVEAAEAEDKAAVLARAVEIVLVEGEGYGSLDEEVQAVREGGGGRQAAGVVAGEVLAGKVSGVPVAAEVREGVEGPVGLGEHPAGEEVGEGEGQAGV